MLRPLLINKVGRKHCLPKGLTNNNYTQHLPIRVVRPPPPWATSSHLTPARAAARVRLDLGSCQKEKGGGRVEERQRGSLTFLHTLGCVLLLPGTPDPSHPLSCPYKWHMSTRTKGWGCIGHNSPVSRSPRPHGSAPGQLRLVGFGVGPRGRRRHTAGGEGRGPLGPASR